MSFAALRRPFHEAPRPSLPAGRRVYAIGDVHGRADRLATLLELIAADDARRTAARTTVVLLGDLIDRGADSAGAINLAMTPLDFADTVTLMGNHEAALLAALAGDARMLALWLAHGGIASLESWGIDATAIESAEAGETVDRLRRLIPSWQLRWLEQRPLSLRIGDHLFVHAGIRPGIPIDRQRAADMLWIRAPFLDSRREHGVLVVHGHTVAPEIVARPNRIGIDTGAGYGGPLTAIGLDGAARWSIRC